MTKLVDSLISDIIAPSREKDAVVQARAEALVSKIRIWRTLVPQLPRAKESARLVEEERELRKDIGMTLGCVPMTLRIDGKSLVYNPKTTLGREDFEAAWKALLPTLSESDRLRAMALLQRKPDRIVHEFATE